MAGCHVNRKRSPWLALSLKKLHSRSTEGCWTHVCPTRLPAVLVEDPNDLSNAIAINSSMTSGARLVGPAVAGLVVAAFGEGWCFLIDGVSYFAVIASLLLMRIQPLNIRPMWPPCLNKCVRYVRMFRPIRAILLLFTLVSLMGYPYMVLLPVFAADRLHGGAATLGWLTAASGIGAITSAVSLQPENRSLGCLA